MKTTMIRTVAGMALLAAAPLAGADPVRLSDLIGRSDGMVVGGKRFNFHRFQSLRFRAEDIIVEAVDRSQSEHGFRLVHVLDDPSGDPSPSDGAVSFTVRSMEGHGRIIRDRIGFTATSAVSGAWVRLNEHVFNANGDELASRSLLIEGGVGQQTLEDGAVYDGEGLDELTFEQDFWIFSAPAGGASAQAMERTFETVSVPLPSPALLGGAGLMALAARRRR
jgi:hypothetical protein